MFAICYYALLCVAYIFMLPILCFFSAFKPKYRHSIPARFFMWKNGAFESANFAPEVWIHACSLGEINSLQAILSESILQKNLLITTTTNTGYTKANELFSAHKSVAIRYLPFEIFIPFIMPKSLKKLVVLEAELWFMLFFCAKKFGAHTILLNARISTKSYPKYKKYKFFYTQFFKCVDKIFVQQKADIERFLALGAESNAQKIETIGNIKALLRPKISQNLKRNLQSQTLIVAASTHKGEEELILRAFKANFIDSPFHRLIIAPRHPERFGEVWEIIKAHNVSATKYSDSGLDYESSVILLDSLGELINIYAIADCVILGGSFVKMGGHNPLECAFFGTQIISGEHIFNQLALFELIENYKIIKNDELIAVLGDLQNLPKSKIKDLALKNMQNKISEIFAD
ncbi:lipid IV(A) 3-deoxy-D-manno-octulosonic acid transferase [Helicobacter sp. 23-1044]